MTDVDQNEIGLRAHEAGDGAGPLSFTVAARVDQPTLAYLEVIEPSASGKGGTARVIVPVIITP